MVESNPVVEGDGIERPIHYANWRTDVPAKPGYSHELISKNVDPKYYDDLAAQPIPYPGIDTFLKFFQRNVRENPDQAFLGTRQQLGNDEKGKPTFGEYTWKTNAEVDQIVRNFAKGMMKYNLCPEIEGEGKQWRFLGIWTKNRWEWTASLIASMFYSVTTVGFYDAMSAEQVDYIINQTEMQTIVCTADYAEKIITMKKAGKASQIKNLVILSELSAESIQAAQTQNITVRTFEAVQQEGANGEAPAFKEPSKDDVYIFSYTSGTTGDPKGVKLSHEGVLFTSYSSIPRVTMNPGETLISYLPYTHSFEQALFGFAMVQKLRIGFYTGDPARLVDDCSKLRPNVFPSVPRLYNRIFSKLKGRLEEATGCKRWLANKALNAKTEAYNTSGVVTHGCYDKLVFSKMSALLGGQVRCMLTGSAPIDKAVVDFLKICFSCPILEGYGLTESAAGSCLCDVDDALTGHVGGPTEAIKIRLKDLPEMSYTSADKPYPRGEICMYGPSIFKGYYKREDKTAEAFTEDGWFLTGDVAMVYPNGSIKIIDRSKNIFKLSQGEYIAPEKIEQIYGLSAMIAQCFVYGDSLQNCCVTIIVPEEEWFRGWARDNNVEGDFAALCKNEQVIKMIKDDMARLGTEKKLSSLEKPKQLVLWPEAFSIENELLTSTFKLKRNVAKQVFKPQIDEMYKLQMEAEEAQQRNRA